MCRRVTCKQCGKPSWAGCGAHVEQVLGDVPKGERCRCGGVSKPAGSFKTTPARGAAATESSGTLGKFAAWLRK